jgi:hypothetical protein
VRRHDRRQRGNSPANCRAAKKNIHRPKHNSISGGGYSSGRQIDCTFRISCPRSDRNPSFDSTPAGLPWEETQAHKQRLFRSAGSPPTAHTSERNATTVVDHSLCGNELWKFSMLCTASTTSVPGQLTGSRLNERCTGFYESCDLYRSVISNYSSGKYSYRRSRQFQERFCSEHVTSASPPK